MQVVRTQKSGVRSQNHTLQWEHTQVIPTGTPCWWRISLLDDTLFGKLTQLWLNLNPNHPWHLGPADLHITSILGTPQSTQPWANAISYAQLYEQASESDRYTSSCHHFTFYWHHASPCLHETLPWMQSLQYFPTVPINLNPYQGLKLFCQSLGHVSLEFQLI